MVRTKSGTFVQDQNRINVGITRAKHGLVIIGSAKALRKEANWAHLLDKKAENVVTGVKEAKQWINKSIQNHLTKEAAREKAART